MNVAPYECLWLLHRLLAPLWGVAAHNKVIKLQAKRSLAVCIPRYQSYTPFLSLEVRLHCNCGDALDISANDEFLYRQITEYVPA